MFGHVRAAKIDHIEIKLGKHVVNLHFDESSTGNCEPEQLGSAMVSALLSQAGLFSKQTTSKR